jgi:hypothetical protein
MRTGLAFITVGIFSCLIGQNPDSYVMGAFAMAGGLMMLGVKGL